MIYLSDYYTALGDIMPTISTIDPTVAFRAINKARRVMCRTTDAGMRLYQFTLAAGTQAYSQKTIPTPPSPIGSPMVAMMEVAIFLGNVRYTLDRIPAGQIPLLNFTSWPFWYYLLAGSLYYYPTPSDAYLTEWKGRLQPIDLDIAQTIPEAVIPESYLDALPCKAAQLLAITDGNAEMIKHYEELYRLEMQQIPKLEI